jgi:hypothetical protein
MIQEELTPNVIFSVSGLPKSGKTHLYMTAPEPIKVYSFDLGADSVRKRKFPNKAIEIHNFYLPIIESEHPQPWAQPVWDEFYSEYKKDVEGGKFKTLAIDTATAVDSILRQAILEEKQEGKPNKEKLATNEYVVRNLRMTAIFARARVAGINLFTVQYLMPEWKKNPNSDKAEPTGRLVPDGWNQTDGQADVVLRMETKIKAGKSVMVCTIDANRFERDFNGKSFEDTTFEEIVTLLLG